jgi:hypothetical protein
VLTARRISGPLIAIKNGLKTDNVNGRLHGCRPLENGCRAFAIASIIKIADYSGVDT